MKPQLANQFNPARDYGVSHFMASPKLDGIRGIYSVGIGLISRSGRKIVGFPEIEQNCLRYAQELNCQHLDGELYSHTLPFPTISSIVATKKPDSRKLQISFNIFAAVGNPSHTTTELMIESLNESFVETIDRNFLKLVPYSRITSDWPTIKNKLEEYRLEGYPEGLMLRHDTVAYSEGRSNNLLKVKNFLTGNATVMRCYEGTGKLKGKLGKVGITADIGGKVINSKIGTGFTDAERVEIWNNRNAYLGREIEINYYSLTVAGSLRMPVFVKFI